MSRQELIQRNLQLRKQLQAKDQAFVLLEASLLRLHQKTENTLHSRIEGLEQRLEQMNRLCATATRYRYEDSILPPSEEERLFEDGNHSRKLNETQLDFRLPEAAGGEG